MAKRSKEELKQLLVDGHLLTGDDCTDVIDSLKGVQAPVTNPSSERESFDGIFVAEVTQDEEGRITPVRRQNTVMKQRALESSEFDLPILFQNENPIMEGAKIDQAAYSKFLHFNPSQGVFAAPKFKGDGSELTNLPTVSDTVLVTITGTTSDVTTEDLIRAAQAGKAIIINWNNDNYFIAEYYFVYADKLYVKTAYAVSLTQPYYVLEGRDFTFSATNTVDTYFYQCYAADNATGRRGTVTVFLTVAELATKIGNSQLYKGCIYETTDTKNVFLAVSNTEAVPLRKAYEDKNTLITPVSGVATWTVTHELGSANVHVRVQCYDATTAWSTAMRLTAGEEIKCQIVAQSNNVSVISLNSAIDIDVDSLMVKIIAM